MKQKNKNKSKMVEFMLIGLIALILVVSSPFFISYKALNYDQIGIIKLGIPIHFIVQHTSLTPDISDFPIYLTVLSPWENPTEIIFRNFVFSFLIAWILLFSMFSLAKFIKVQRLKKRIISALALIIVLLSYSVYWVFFDLDRLPEGSLISEVQSPDGTYTLKAYLVNGGATVSYAVRGELVFNEKRMQPKNIYWNYREEEARIEWIDGDTVVINGHELDVNHDRYDYRRE